MNSNSRKAKGIVRIRKTLESNGYFHDWYIVSVYMANTGEQIVRYSQPGLTTIQVVLANSNADFSHTLIFVDTSSFFISSSQDPNSYERHYTFNGFQRILDFSIENEDKTIKATIECESDSRIILSCRSIVHRKNQLSIYE